MNVLIADDIDFSDDDDILISGTLDTDCFNPPVCGFDILGFSQIKISIVSFMYFYRKW